MCKVKTGRAVLNLQDVQNLVTGIIFRQESSFQRDELLDAVKHYMVGSPMQKDQQKIAKIIDMTLMTSISNEWLICRYGSYYPQRWRGSLRTE